METIASQMTVRHKPITLSAAALVCSLLLFVPRFASADLSEEESLKGISGVMVIIERLHTDAAAIGLERETLDAVVRDGLQKANVKILSPDERAADERRPYLYVNCNVMDMKNPALIAFSIDIEVHQRVTLTGGEKTQAQTWAKSYLGIQSADQAAEQIRHVLSGYVDQFLDAYKKANPGAAASPATQPAPAPAPTPAPAPAPADSPAPTPPGD